MEAMRHDIDPMHYAGEGFTSTEEIPRIEDIANAHVRGRAKREGEYWPGGDKKR